MEVWHPAPVTLGRHERQHTIDVSVLHEYVLVRGLALGAEEGIVAPLRRHRHGLERPLDDLLIEEVAELGQGDGRLQLLLTLSVVVVVKEVELLLSRQEDFQERIELLFRGTYIARQSG